VFGFPAPLLQFLAAMASSARLVGHHTLVPHQSGAVLGRNSLASCNGVRIWKEFAPVTLKCKGAGRYARVGRAAVVTVENYVSGAPSLGEITKGDFPILDQVGTPIFVELVFMG